MDHFIILAHARTGSTWLSTSLGSHPQITSGGEIFSNGNRHWTKWKEEQGQEKWQEYIKHMYKYGETENKITQNTVAVGYKLLYDHDVKEIDISLIPQDVKIIHLKRKRNLMCLTSQILAKKSGLLGLKNPWQQPYVNQRIIVPIKKMFWEINAYKKQWKHFDETFKNNEIIEIWYEQMVANPEKEQNRVLDFIGIKKIPLISRIKKQRNKLLREIIINYDEVSQHLIKAL